MSDDNTEDASDSTLLVTVSNLPKDPRLERLRLGIRRWQYWTTIVITFGGFISGLSLAYTSCALQSLRHSHMVDTYTQESLVGACMPLGAFLSCLLAGIVSQKIGRLSALIFAAIFSSFGWAVIGCSTSLTHILIGRFLTGVGTGSITSVAPSFVTECVQMQIRGAMGAMFQVQVTLGILLSYVAGAYIDSWRWLAIACALISILWLILLECGCIYESPVWLMVRQRELDAYAVLIHLRGRYYNVLAEMDVIRESVRRTVYSNESAHQCLHLGGICPFFARVWPPLRMALLIMFFQQMNGVNSVIFYAHDIFARAGNSSAFAAAAVVGVTQFVSTCASVFLVERVGRRFLLTVSAIIMCLALCTLGSLFYVRDHVALGGVWMCVTAWLATLSVIVFVVAFSLGYGPVPWIMIGELFTIEYRSLAGGIVLAFNWFMVTFITLTFKFFQQLLTDYGTYWMFSFVCVCGTVFSRYFVLETKGMSLEQISRYFNI